MQPYFLTHVEALIDEGIAEINEEYDEMDKDENGIPKQPIAFWKKGEEWRYGFTATTCLPAAIGCSRPARAAPPPNCSVTV